MKKRRPWLAAILSLIQPGLGHLYAGSLRRAAILLTSPFLLLLLLRWIFLGSPVMATAGLVLVVIFWIVVSWDAAKRAREACAATLRWFQRWYVYPLLVVVISFSMKPVFGGFLNRVSRFQAFRVPSRTMENTIHLNDRVMTDMWHYRWNEPERGEIVVFQYPVDPERDFLKRCVAVPGDTVEIRGKTLLLNGEAIDEVYVIHRDVRIIPNSPEIPSSRRLRDNFGPFTVPSESIFVLGDNRDNSFDSRYFGVVPYELLHGKALWLFWGSTIDRVGSRLE